MLSASLDSLPSAIWRHRKVIISATPNASQKSAAHAAGAAPAAFLPSGLAVRAEVCLDDQGRSQFNELLFRRGEPRFYALDLLWRDGKDLRY